MWCWRRVEEIIWTDHVRNAEVLQEVEGYRNVLQKIKKGKLTLLFNSCMGAGFYSALLKGR
jgi:hypothetical protein